MKHSFMSGLNSRRTGTCYRRSRGKRWSSEIWKIN